MAHWHGCENMTSSIKPEVGLYNISGCHQRTTEPWQHALKIGEVRARGF